MLVRLWAGMALDASGINYLSLLSATEYMTLSLRVLGSRVPRWGGCGRGWEAIACLRLSLAIRTDAQLTCSFVVCLGCQLHTLIMGLPTSTGPV